MGIKGIRCGLSPETPAENLDTIIEAALSHKG
jgi:hypothetical protein